jgi:hypothetical protein
VLQGAVCETAAVEECMQVVILPETAAALVQCSMGAGPWEVGSCTAACNAVLH